MKRIAVLGTVVLAGILTAVVGAQQQPPAVPTADNLTVERVKDTLWVIRGSIGNTSGGGNTAVFATSTGLTVVDTKSPGWGPALLDKIKTISDKPVTTVINTHTHYDHVSGNVALPPTVEVVTQENTAKMMPNTTEVLGRGTTVNVFKENPGKGLPTRTFKNKLTLNSGADQINLYYFGPAHTGGDAFVEFPALHVMHVGDTFPNKGLPIMDSKNGGSGIHYADTLEKALNGVKGVDTIINGHTPAQTTSADMKEYVAFLRDFVAFAQAGKKAGKPPGDLAKEWKTPDKYKGYQAAPPAATVQLYIELIFSETK